MHDPSLVVDDGEFYVVGSHLAAARTADLVGWEQVAHGVSAETPLFEDVLTELEETFDRARTDTLRAADVIFLSGPGSVASSRWHDAVRPAVRSSRTGHGDRWTSASAPSTR